MSSEQPVERASLKACGVVSLTTDFGLRDPYVGQLEGVLLSVLPSVRTVHLTHGLAQGDLAGAAFVLAHSFGYFPAGSVHLAVVDPGVGSARRMLAAIDRGHAFLAPDNGLLGPVLSGAAEVRALDVERFSLPGRSRTFHGRDVFAPAAARLAGGLDPRELGPLAGDWERLDLPRPRAEAGRVRGRVVSVDGFGNLITDVAADLLAGPAGAWSALLAGSEVAVRGTYAEVEPGELVALVSSFGLLEIARRDGDAARALGAGPGDEVVFTMRSDHEAGRPSQELAR
jgi:hypothetical protein